MLIGNLGADPEIRYTAAGAPVANVSLATAESWRDKESGELREKQNGIEWYFSERLLKPLKNMSLKAPRSLSKESYKPENGKIKMAKIDTQPR